MSKRFSKSYSGIAIAALSLLTACAHINEQAALPKSTGRVSPLQHLVVAQVSLKIPSSLAIQISKSDRTNPWISEIDKLAASSHISNLTSTLRSGVKDRLPIAASKYGLSVVSFPANAPEFRISVVGSHMSCSSDYCSYWLELTGEVFSEKGELTWATKTSMSMSSGSRLSYETAFDDFMGKLLAAMRRDQLLRQ